MAYVGADIQQSRMYKRKYDIQITIMDSLLKDWLLAFQELVNSLEGMIQVKLQELLDAIKNRLFANYSAEYINIGVVFDTIANEFSNINGGE